MERQANRAGVGFLLGFFLNHEGESYKLEVQFGDVMETKGCCLDGDNNKVDAILLTVENVALAKLEDDKRYSFIKAWEESKKTKVENKAHKQLYLCLGKQQKGLFRKQVKENRVSTWHSHRKEAIERGSGAVADGARYWQLRRRYGFLLGFSAILAYGVTVGGGVSMVFANLGRGGPFRRSSTDVG
ncbi:hypothetical protein CASFOL_023909 [Castilleja foliolosa]|uniref:RDR1/2-like PH-like domain-containing protein n=1 Tax=Castilleja foliolosa TaxID=1961234 RepID=A0ABD3CQC6_9LAMI